MMNIEIKKMETDEEIRGKAYVHWKSWHEAFTGLIENKYIDGLTIEKCEEWGFRWPENTLVAKDGERVVGFVCYGDRGDEAPGYGEIFALYVLSEYYGKGISSKLMQAGLEHIRDYPIKCLWVLKNNARAIRFYQKCGFQFDGTETVSSNIAPAVEVRMVLAE